VVGNAPTAVALDSNTIVPVAGSPHHGAKDGSDRAEVQAAQHRLGYDEQRKFPFGMIFVLLVITVVTLIVARRYREPQRAGAA
jgi:hypothetical protein